MTGILRDRVAVITGASRGQGEATARLFVAEGAKVVLADIIDEGQTVAASLGDAAIFHKLDVTSEDGWTGLVAKVVSHWGGIDILVNNAGIVHPAGILDLKKSDFERVLNINLIGAWLGIKTVAPVMIDRGKGSIINIVSTSGLFGMNGLSAYQASKWALRGLSKTAALELGHRGVRVNSVYPGGINTPMGNITGEPVEDLGKYYVGQPIQRIGEPIEVAQVSLFLASDNASYMCGSELTVDGGQTLGSYTSFLPGAPDNFRSM